MELMGQGMAVLGVLGLLAGVLFWLERRGLARMRWAPRSKTKKLQVVERLHLTHQHSLHLISVEGRQMLIAVSPQQCQVLESGTPSSQWQGQALGQAGASR